MVTNAERIFKLHYGHIDYTHRKQWDKAFKQRFFAIGYVHLATLSVELLFFLAFRFSSFMSQYTKSYLLASGNNWNFMVAEVKRRS